MVARLPFKLDLRSSFHMAISSDSNSPHTTLKLGDVLDVASAQSLADDLYALAKLPVGILDIDGTVFVATGWQDICTQFHRVHPESCKHCIESDRRLGVGIPAGEYRLYKCLNNMWDMATPLIVDGQHLGNVVLGQFFFEDETLDVDQFREQARRYGFDEERYLAALEKVPRFSREYVTKGMSYLRISRTCFLKWATTISDWRGYWRNASCLKRL